MLNHLAAAETPVFLRWGHCHRSLALLKQTGRRRVAVTQTHTDTNAVMLRISDTQKAEPTALQ